MLTFMCTWCTFCAPLMYAEQASTGTMEMFRVVNAKSRCLPMTSNHTCYVIWGNGKFRCTIKSVAPGNFGVWNMDQIFNTKF